MHLRGSQHLAQEGLQLRVHLRQRLLQGCWLDALIRSTLVLVRNLQAHSTCAWHASHDSVPDAVLPTKNCCAQESGC